jgi:diaminohydroxyphosphoribosylaminopyrimidine deaminase/5-amino-6-(5-phosphoribosylamino)uracil reductase
MKIAASLDGRTALENGASQWITSEAARADGHRWRARASAVLTGIGTVLQDDPQMNVRAVATTRQPVKVVVDRHGQLPAGARLLQDGEIIVVSAEAKPHASWASRVESMVLPDGDGRVDLRAMMDALGARGMNEVHVEAGAKLNAALLEAEVVDELLVYVAPCLIGDPARGMLARGSPLAALGQATRLAIDNVQAIGEDWRITARVLRSGAINV